METNIPLAIFRYYQKDNLFYNPIKDSLSLLNFGCRRADACDNSNADDSENDYEIPKPQRDSINDIKTWIHESPFVVADISHDSIKKTIGNRVIRRPFNENVYFEIGYAAGQNKEILLFKNITKGCIGRAIPFDIREYTIIGFQTDDLRGLELSILICSWIKNNTKLNMDISSRFIKPDSSWHGEYSKKETIHEITMEWFGDESILCTINISRDNKDYIIKEICKFKYNRNGQKFFEGKAFYNANEESRLDYWLDGFLIKVNGDVIDALVFDAVNKEKTSFKLFKVNE